MAMSCSKWAKFPKIHMIGRMAPRHVPFPFERVPPGEINPQPGSGDPQQLLQRDIQIIRWFIEKREGRQIKASPLGGLLDAYAQVDLKNPSKTIEDLPPRVAQFQLHAGAHFFRLAWAIRVLCKNDALEQVDGSFISTELLGEDTNQAGIAMKLPGGIGTLVFAARLFQAGGGRIWISGNKREGHDIRWVTPAGDTALVERKDRSYEVGLSDTDQQRAAKVVQEVENAHIPVAKKTIRVLVVGFQHLVRGSEEEMERVEAICDGALRKAFGNSPSGNFPHLVVVEHLGMEPRTDGEKSNFFSPHEVKRGASVMKRIGPLILRAIGFPE